MTIPPAPAIRLAKVAAVIGGGLGCMIVLIVLSSQINLRDILSGQLPWSVVFVLYSNTFIFLLFLLFLFIIGIVVALWQGFSRIWAGSVWLGIGGILAYVIYITRFSIGPLLIPSAILFMAAACLLIAVATIIPNYSNSIKNEEKF